MKIGERLREARVAAGLTQEIAAEKMNVSRQTISNWETERTYPDIISVIKMSDIYSISLDELMKGDPKMIKHLEESVDVVKSNRRLISAILFNIVLVIFLIIFGVWMPYNSLFFCGVFCLMVISTSILLYQIIKRL